MPITKKFVVPEEVSRITDVLEKNKFEAYLIGGCVRDLFLGKTPKDWDVTTDATPEEIIALFEKTFYENDYGTVGVVNENTENKSLAVIEVTPYRVEAVYSDARRPDSVTFSKNFEDDLKRRDFSVNAIAYNQKTEVVVDLYQGQKDLEDKVIRAVGDPEERFTEDALRILRAIRLSAELGFSIEEKTKEAIQNTAKTLEKIAKERIRDEFTRIINSDQPKEGMVLAHSLGVLQYVAPDLLRGIDVGQNQAHKYDVWEHNLRTVQHAADKGWPFDIRIAALFHDVSKPETRRWSDEKKDWTFHGHDVVGARVTKKILSDLRYPNDVINKTVKMVRWHMFFSDPEQITLSAVRRMIRNVGEENIWDLMDLRICDRVGTGRPKEQPFRFRKYKSMVEEALRDPTSVGMLKIDGEKIMTVLQEKPGPKIGHILHALLEEVLEDPGLNTKEYLKKRVEDLSKLPDKELRALGEKGREKKDEVEEQNIKEIRDKYWVK